MVLRQTDVNARRGFSVRIEDAAAQNRQGRERPIEPDGDTAGANGKCWLAEQTVLRWVGEAGFFETGEIPPGLHAGDPPDAGFIRRDVVVHRLLGPQRDFNPAKTRVRHAVGDGAFDCGAVLGEQPRGHPDQQCDALLHINRASE
ncbi:MAG: hypothetical protein LAP40_22665 [Acidobacteriia bacterium]|nr:hypothetical protein [Terriglobia bacterium]